MKIDESGWDQAEFKLRGKRGGRRPGAGRKKGEHSKVFRSVGLTPEQWEFLELWLPGGNSTSQLQELIERCQKFWPAGPNKFR